VGNATYGVMNTIFGENYRYDNDSWLFRSVDNQGVLGTVGTLATGTVLGLPGISQVNALYHNDWYGLGASIPVTALAVGGMFSAMGDPWAVTSSDLI